MYRRHFSRATINCNVFPFIINGLIEFLSDLLLGVTIFYTTHESLLPAAMSSASSSAQSRFKCCTIVDGGPIPPWRAFVTLSVQTSLSPLIPFASDPMIKREQLAPDSAVADDGNRIAEAVSLRGRHLEVRNFRGIKSLKWRIMGDLNCIIGSGDACKTTILTALDYALSPRTALAFDDADFFNQAVDDDIVIQVTLGDWDETQPHIKAFFQESTFARYQCGLGADGPEAEPNGMTAFSVSLRVDKSLEPKWFAVKGPIYAAERALIGLSRLDLFSDAQFTWGRNTILTRLSEGTKGSLTGVVSELAREMRQSDISGHQSIAQCKSVADTVRVEARNAGVNLGELAPKIDVQRNSIGVGVISLHEGQVPLRNKGSGSKRLVGAAMQMKLHNGKNIAVIDEIELGLEPYRIRGLLHRLKASQQQVFATTHSAAVIRELDVTKQELWVCWRDSTSAVIVKSLNTVSGIQGPVRTNAEAFLGNRTVTCEGLTEIGLLRAYDGKQRARVEPRHSLF